MYQASHLNIKEKINSQGALMLLQSTLYSRLGIAHLSDVYCDLLLHCHGNSCPIDEHIRAVCRGAFSVGYGIPDRVSVTDVFPAHAKRAV